MTGSVGELPHPGGLLVENDSWPGELPGRLRADNREIPAAEMVVMERIRLNEETGIPLYLIPEKIKCRIKKTGDRIYRISVQRTEHHHYSISVRTKTLPRELMPVRDRDAKNLNKRIIAGVVFP